MPVRQLVAPLADPSHVGVVRGRLLRREGVHLLAVKHQTVVKQMVVK
jgi:hypothetical protein